MHRIHRFVFLHRRSLAAACAALAVVSTISAVRPDGVPVAVAAHDLPSGTLLTADDVRTATLPKSVVPRGASDDGDLLVGRLLGGPVRAGEPLTDRRVVDPRDLSGYGVVDPVLSTVALADAAVLRALRPGDVVDIVATDPEGTPEVVAGKAVVAALGPADQPSISVVTRRDAALALAANLGARSLTVLARPTDVS